MASNSSAEKIRKKVAEVFGEAGMRFQTRDVTNSDLFKEFNSGSIGTALANWVDNKMIVDGYALDLERDGENTSGRRFWRLKYVWITKDTNAPAKSKASAKQINETADLIGSEDAVFAARILQIKKDSMLVESRGKLYRVSPLDW